MLFNKNPLKYIFLAVIIFGCFANFAENEYGWYIIVSGLLGLSVIFIFEVIYTIRRIRVNTKSIWKKIFFLLSFDDLFSWEIFPLFFITIGFLFSTFPGGKMMVVAASVFLALTYIYFALYYLIKNFRMQKMLTTVTFVSFLFCGFSFLNFFMDFQHIDFFIYLPVFLFALSIILLIFKRIFYVSDTKINFTDNLKKLSINSFFALIISSVITIYYFAGIFDIAPKFYSSGYPVVYYKLQEEAQRNFLDPAAGEKMNKFRDDHELFFKNRKKEEQQ